MRIFDNLPFFHSEKSKKKMVELDTDSRRFFSIPGESTQFYIDFGVVGIPKVKEARIEFPNGEQYIAKIGTTIVPPGVFIERKATSEDKENIMAFYFAQPAS